MSIRTGICKHCLGTMEQHVAENECKNFTDSGLASLHEHAEELYEAILKYKRAKTINAQLTHWEEVESILKKIKP